MLRKSNCTIWLYDFSETRTFLEKLCKAFSKANLTTEKWDYKCAIEMGVIIIESNKHYDGLISLLNIQLKSKGNRIIVINASEEALSRNAILKILNYGAEYYFESYSIDKDFENVIEKILRWRNIESILHSPVIKNNIAGESAELKKMLRNIIEVTVYSAASVLILGERGTGKELVAKIIHEMDITRSKGNFVLVDCTTIRPELSGSEFFGHEKGSYTGADHSREGAFALANHGTLFLDEVGELPLTMQAELLRIIQEGAYKKVGSNIWKQANFRLVSATNRDLEAESEKGNFRKDLFDRISIWQCYIPSLNERREDIPLLIESFFRKKFPENMPVIDKALFDYLQNRNYPGNIRELQNLISRIALRYIGKGPVTIGDMPDYERTSNFKDIKAWFENSILAESINQALNDGYDIKNIVDTIKTMATTIALSITDNNKEMSALLGKSERWIQMHKSKIS
jgi:transcriptional regulator with GAF, ATPase, and Fis domain